MPNFFSAAIAWLSEPTKQYNFGFVVSAFGFDGTITIDLIRFTPGPT
jgi:hypothetical protein